MLEEKEDLVCLMKGREKFSYLLMGTHMSGL